MMMRVLLVLLVLLGVDHASAEPSVEVKLLKEWAECKSDDQKMYEPTVLYDKGQDPTIEMCATACFHTKDCKFFIFGRPNTSKAGRCYMEHTKAEPTPCSEGWEVDAYDFYMIKQMGLLGCTQPLSMNYDPLATVDNGKCTEADACWKRDERDECVACTTCTKENPCEPAYARAPDGAPQPCPRLTARAGCAHRPQPGERHGVRVARASGHDHRRRRPPRVEHAQSAALLRARRLGQGGQDHRGLRDVPGRQVVGTGRLLHQVVRASADGPTRRLACARVREEWPPRPSR